VNDQGEILEVERTSRIVFTLVAAAESKETTLVRLSVAVSPGPRAARR
jgi:uncharacterized protein YndB with AHSA1/START domain